MHEVSSCTLNPACMHEGWMRFPHACIFWHEVREGLRCMRVAYFARGNPAWSCGMLHRPWFTVRGHGQGGVALPRPCGKRGALSNPYCMPRDGARHPPTWPQCRQIWPCLQIWPCRWEVAPRGRSIPVTSQCQVAGGCGDFPRRPRGMVIPQHMDSHSQSPGTSRACPPPARLMHRAPA